MPELRDVSTDQQDQGLSETLVIDRDTASRLGISASAIDQVLYDAFGQREVSTMYTGLNQYFVVMEVDPQYQLSPDSLNNIYIKTGSAGAPASVPNLGSTTASASPRRPLRPRSAAARSVASAAPASFVTAGGQLVTTSTASSLATAPASSGASSVATNIAAIAASNDESTNAAAIQSGTLSGTGASASTANASPGAAAAAAGSDPGPRKHGRNGAAFSHRPLGGETHLPHRQSSGSISGGDAHISISPPMSPWAMP